MKVTVIYGTDGGNTRTIAEQIAAQFGGTTVEISTAEKAHFEECDLLILGTPTCGYGDLQFDWENRLEMLKEVNLSGPKVALFGLGDQGTYADTFADAMGVLYEKLTENGVKVIGFTSTEDYDYYSSRAVYDDTFVGLVIDEDIQPHMTEDRIASWVASLKLAVQGELSAQHV